MIPEDAERRITACWDRRLAPEELVVLLDDDREWRFGGTPSFDGDATTAICHVSVTALRTLAAIAPASAPMARVADVLIRMSGKTTEIVTCTYDSPWEKPLVWKATDVTPFGPALIAALQKRLDDADPAAAERAREVLAAIAAKP